MVCLVFCLEFEIPISSFQVIASLLGTQNLGCSLGQLVLSVTLGCHLGHHVSWGGGGGTFSSHPSPSNGHHSGMWRGWKGALVSGSQSTTSGLLFDVANEIRCFPLPCPSPQLTSITNEVATVHLAWVFTCHVGNDISDKRVTFPICTHPLHQCYFDILVVPHQFC